jgi:hypothetical protein
MPALRWPPGCLFAATPRLSLALAPPAPPHPQRALGFRRTPGPQSESWPGYTPAPWRRCAAAPPRAPRDSARPRRARSSHSDATPHCGEEKRSGRDVGVRNDAPVQSDHAHARAPPSPPRFATQALPARTPPAESETKKNCSAVVDGHAWLLQRCKVLFSGPTSSSAHTLNHPKPCSGAPWAWQCWVQAVARRRPPCCPRPKAPHTPSSVRRRLRDCRRVGPGAWWHIGAGTPRGWMRPSPPSPAPAGRSGP